MHGGIRVSGGLPLSYIRFVVDSVIKEKLEDKVDENDIFEGKKEQWTGYFELFLAKNIFIIGLLNPFTAITNNHSPQG